LTILPRSAIIQGKEFEMCFSIFKKKTVIPEPVIPDPVIPESETIEMTRADFIKEMNKQGIKAFSELTPLDSTVRLASKAELDRIAPELVYPADWYINDIYDCEDYGLQAQLDAGRKFEITVRLGLGNTELGYHGFAITLDRDLNLWLLEPNVGFPWAGVWFKDGENDYHPDKVFI